jgi:predicted nucleic acid-binding protein
VKIVVDTNIIFSALLNSDGLIGDLLFNSYGIFIFYSCNYMRKEIEKHKLLYQGLKQKNFARLFNSSELLSLRLSIS